MWISTKMQFWDNLGCFLTTWEPQPTKKISLAGNFKLWPIVEVCTVLRGVLAKTPKIILRNKEKGHFVSFSAHYSAQRNFFKEKFQRNSNGNQDGIQATKMQFWVNLGCFWTHCEPHTTKKNFLWLEISNYDPLWKSVQFWGMF